MALLDFFRRRRPDLTTKAVYDDSKFIQSSISILDNAVGRGKLPPFSMQRSVLSFESWVYAAAMLNAQAASSVPLRLYVRTDAQGPQKFWRTRKVSRSRKAYLLGDSERKPSPSVMKSAATAGDFEEVVDAHPILELLRKANQYEDGFSQSVMRMLYMELCGNAYLHVIMDKALGVPSELFTVPAQNVTILPGKTELIEAYLYGTDRNSMQRFELDEIIHFKRPNPRNLYYGLGKVEAAYGAIQQSQAAQVQDLAFLENCSRPDYAAIVKGGASEASMRRFEESMRSLHQGTRKSGRMVTISGDIQLMPLNFPNKDLTGRDDIVEMISSTFGVPISMLKANDPNLASAQAGYSMWRETTIAPICRMDEETLNSRLLPLFDIHEDAYLAYDNPVPENRVADSAERSVAVAGGWRTPNEARLEEGYEALETPHADMLHVNGLPLGGVAPVSPFGAPAPLPSYAAPAPVDEPAQLPPTAEVEQPAKALSDVDTTPTDEVSREQKMANARVKIAALEAKAWDAVQQQPKFDALQAELDAMKERTASLDEIVTMLTEALGDES